MRLSQKPQGRTPRAFLVCAFGTAVAGIALAGCGGGGGSAGVPTLTAGDSATNPFAGAPRATTAALGGPNGRIAFNVVPANGNSQDIFVMNPDGSHIARLTHFAATGGFAFFQHWSPDSKRIIFTLSTAQAQDLWTMNADGSNQKLLYHDPNPNNYANGGSFSPDGKHVVLSYCFPYATSPYGVYCTIARLNADGTGLTHLTRVNPLGLTFDFSPSYSPDGRTIVFQGDQRGGYRERLYLIDADGSNLRPLTPPELGAFDADWSRDAGRIAFATYSHGNDFGANEEIWTIDRWGGRARQVTFNNDNHQLPYLQANHDSYPAWAPRGNAIAFNRQPGDKSTYGIDVVRADGSSLFQALAMQPAINRPVGFLGRAMLRGRAGWGRRFRRPKSIYESDLCCGDPSWGSPSAVTGRKGSL